MCRHCTWVRGDHGLVPLVYVLDEKHCKLSTLLAVIYLSPKNRFRFVHLMDDSFQTKHITGWLILATGGPKRGQMNMEVGLLQFCYRSVGSNR